jgi:predicted dehydrogenase
MRWGVLGGSSRIYLRSLRPAFEAVGHEVVAAPSRVDGNVDAYLDMLGRSDIDAVYNPLPNDMHAEWTHRALDAGKHVLCEKPLTLSPHHTAEVFDHAESVGRTVLEAYMWPHHPRAQHVLDLVRSGAIGAPQWGRAQFSWPIDQASGDHRLDHRGAGALFDVGIYCIAPFMLMSRREPETLHASAVRNHLGVDLTMSGQVDWGAGFTSSFHVSFDAPHTRSWALAGTNETLDIPGLFVPGPAEPSDVVRTRRDGTQVTDTCAGGSAYATMVRHFEDVAMGGCSPVFGRVESERLARTLARLHAASATR